jgi:hypothetical protein
LAIGAGGHLVRAHGTGASSLFRGLDGSSLGLAVAGGGGVAARLGKHLALVLDGRAAALQPEASIKVADEEVGRTGGMALLLTLSVTSAF